MKIREKLQKIRKKKSFKVLTVILGVLLVLFLAFVGWIWFTTFQPDQVQPASLTSSDNLAQVPKAEKIKLLSWNVQFMAGKGYDFYYEGGPDTRPSSEDIAETTEEVARVIKEEDPDIVLLQEVDDGARRTDHEDQLENLLEKLPAEYGAHSSAFYWKAAFSPHPEILGSVGMKLSVISKFKIGNAFRHQLSLKPDNWFVRQFDLKRAVLEVRFPRRKGRDLVVFNTHLTAFTFGSDVRRRQLREVHQLVREKSSEGVPWILGGDFNLLPPGKGNKDEEGEVIRPLFDDFGAVPGYEEVNGPNPEAWYTHFPNDPDINEPDRTIDYLFFPGEISLGDHYIRREDTLRISDHLPVLAEIELPA
ncbi:MAG: endonuclease/exonuclease/phosphatase family protein [Candidatus Acetothermia bacterium]